jgi:hypothetical protein
MKWSVSSILMSATVVGMLCIPRIAAASGSIDASGGRITFTGAIVEPTCSVSAANIDAAAMRPAKSGAAQHRFVCGAARTTEDSAQLYSLTVVSLDAATINHDRVLDYFAGYVKAAGNNEAVPKLVTQSFE